jgi:preprotein translocase subunit SecE
VAGIVVFAIVLCLILWGIDWVIRRVSQRTSAA